jgi:hypothetical protein
MEEFPTQQNSYDFPISDELRGIDEEILLISRTLNAGLGENWRNRPGYISRLKRLKADRRVVMERDFLNYKSNEKAKSREKKEAEEKAVEETEEKDNEVFEENPILGLEL